MKQNLYQEFIIEEKQQEIENSKIARAIKLFTGEGNVCRVSEEENGIYIIQYEHDEDLNYWGGPRLIWVTDEEYDMIMDNRAKQEQTQGVEEYGEDQS